MIEKNLDIIYKKKLLLNTVGKNSYTKYILLIINKILLVQILRCLYVI